MVQVRESTVIDAPVDEVWRVLRDFNGHDRWHPAVASSVIEQGAPADMIGAVRRFRLSDGGELREQLLAMSDRDRSFSYCILEAPIPLMGYVAEVRLKPVTDRSRTFWEWRSTFHPPDERRAELVSLVRDGIYRAGFAAIREMMRTSSPRLGLARAETLASGPPSPSRPFASSGLNTSPPGKGGEDGLPVWRPSSPSRSGGEVVSAANRRGGEPTSESASLPTLSKPVFEKAEQDRTRAILVERYGGPEVLQPREIALGAPGPGEVLIRHTAIGVNYIDVYCRTGYFDLLKPPGVPGMEAAGVIEAVGPGVDGLEPGDRVAYACPPVGAYAERRVMASDLLVRLGDDIPDALAAAGLLKGVTASFLLHDVFPVRSGHVVLVHAAAGGVGQLLVQWARHLGATVIATASTPDKADLAHRLGAHHAVATREQDFVAAAMAVTNGRGVDVIYDAVGRDTFEKSLAALALRGHLVSFGQASGPVGSWDIGRFASKSVTISRPNYGHYTDTPEKLAPHVARFFSAWRAGAVIVAEPTRYPLAAAAQAHADLEARRTTGSVILVP